MNELLLVVFNSFAQVPANRFEVNFKAFHLFSLSVFISEVWQGQYKGFTFYI